MSSMAEMPTPAGAALHVVPPRLELGHFQGQPCVHLLLPGGDSVRIALHGAQVLSWVCGGRERLYLSPQALFDGRSAIRGGIPICFPQFNQRGTLPKHGFVRNVPWETDPSAEWVGSAAQFSLSLADTPETRALWPHAFAISLTVQLAQGSLQVTLTARNNGNQALAFTGALHTYLAVSNVGDVWVSGLDGQPSWDALTDQLGLQEDDIFFDGEFDRVFVAAPAPLTLHDGKQRLRIAQSDSLADTVVWNPGEALCQRLSDMPPDGYRHMLCIEAAQVLKPVTLAAGASWQGWQRLTVL